ncbi:MAG: hypothetical protein KatS3mg110_2416 [Pirellulaceae bacterium]|nr:MAG: hypothetical protein KatS3mg110_2416 [Pirellulaceae bacterium]
MRVGTGVWIVLLVGCLLTVRADERVLQSRGPLHEQPSVRRPVALAFVENERFLAVANRCGTVSVVDTDGWQVVAEYRVGERLSAMAAVGPQSLLVTDEAGHRLWWLQVRDGRLHQTRAIDVSSYPVCVVFDARRSCAYVASLWSRRLTCVWLLPERMAIDRVIDLPLAPRSMTLAPDENTLVVADSFNGRLGLVDLEGWCYRTTRTFPAHNIRGLASSPDGKMLVVAHQMLNDLAQTTSNDIHWGLLMSNDLRWLQWGAVLDPQADLYRGAHMHPLGEPGRATADPSGLAMTRQGVVVVTIGGMDEVALGRESDFSLYRLKVGRRPTAVIVNRSGDLAVVANSFADTLSLVDLVGRRVVGEVSLGPMAPLSEVERGEMLFYDGRLSHDGWMSCHSCHTDGHTNGGLNDNLSDHTFGAPKRVLSLLGVADTAPYAWLGHVPDLETQIDNSIQKTMQGPARLSAEDRAALVAYLKSLKPPPALDAARGVVDRQNVEKGREVFERRGCKRCHAPPTYTTPDTYDVGLVDQRDNRRFNPPSLLGVSQRGPYLHDNSVEQLEDLFLLVGHPNDSEYSDEEVRLLVAFLRSL